LGWGAPGAIWGAWGAYPPMGPQIRDEHLRVKLNFFCRVFDELKVMTECTRLRYANV